MPLTVTSFGPFVKGVSDARNTSLDARGYVRSARHVLLRGAGQFVAGPGSEVAITLMDDAMTPAEVTSVCGLWQFGDDVLAVGHSTATDKAYLYWLDTGFTGWYDIDGVFEENTEAEPLGVLWSSMTTSPTVHLAEMLGSATITCTTASDETTATFVTRRFVVGSLADYVQDLNGDTNDEDVYALGCIAFQSHLWVWGFGMGTDIADTYRPELLRFGGPNGGELVDDGGGSIGVGHRVRSARERVVGACVAGDVLYVGTPYSLWPIVGYGRDTWDKSKPLDDSFGFIGPTCAVSANGVCYYWSSRGPMRVAGLSRPEPLWDRVPETVDTVIDAHRIVAVFDAESDQVQWYYRAGEATGNQLVCAFDTRRDVFVGPDTDAGLAVGAAARIEPVADPAAGPSQGPSGPPTTAVTSSVTARAAVAEWTAGDTTAFTRVYVRVQGTTPWTLVGTTPPGVEERAIAGLVPGQDYEWKAQHQKNGQLSSALGPVAGSQFTTASTLAPPTSTLLTDVGPALLQQGLVTWVNGADGGETEVVLDNVYQGKAAEGEASYYVTVSATASYTVKTRHIASGVTASAYDTPASATLTYGESE